jgi:peptidoglycan LD-endopeptidase LytH
MSSRQIAKLPAIASFFLLLSLFLISVQPTASSLETSYIFPIEKSRECGVKFARYHHDYAATDIITKKGCKFLSPVSGVIDEVSRKDIWNGRENLGATRGGKFVSVIGDDGVRYYGSHLHRVTPGIKKGVRVEAGSELGEVGTTGSARGTSPHLHFGISWPTDPGVWWVRRGVVLPYPYLNAWRSGENLSPVKAVKKAERKIGSTLSEPRK